MIPLQACISEAASNDVNYICALDFAHGHNIFPGWQERLMLHVALAQHMQLLSTNKTTCMKLGIAGRQQADSAVVGGAGSVTPRSGYRCTCAG